MRTNIQDTCVRFSATLLLAFTIVAAPTAAGNPRPRPDFNGDWVADLAVAAPLEDIGAAIDTGVVHVIYGRRGLGLGPANQRLEAGNITIMGGHSENQTGLHFGQALAWGDFNGDGFDDLAIGGPGYHAGALQNVGFVYVLYGSAKGLVTAGVPYYVSTNIGPPLNVNMDPNDFFGAALAAGDFNGDGVSDLAIGVPGQAGWDGAHAIPNAGEVYVLYGRGGELAAGGGLVRASAQGWSQNGRLIWPDILGSPQPGGQFGASLAAGNFNRSNIDTFDDLAIGAPGYVGDRGAVNVIYGSPAGLHPNLAAVNQIWFQDIFGLGGSAPGNRFGQSLAAGDFNHTTRDDLAIGAPNATETFGGVRRGLAGTVVVIYGSALGLDTVAGGVQLWTENRHGVPNDGTLEGDHFGWALASGDFNADGFADLAVGVPNDDPGPGPGATVDSAGSVIVIYGSGGGLNAVVPLLSQFWHQDGVRDNVPVQGNNEPNQLFGSSLSVGDFDADGVADLAIGVPGDIVAGVRCGAVNVIYGSFAFGIHPAAGPPAGNQLWHQNNLGTAGVEPCQAGAGFGTLR